MKLLQIVAHELGHNLNMRHDFIDPFSVPKTDRFSADGTKCTDDNGIMDYNVVSIMFDFQDLLVHILQNILFIVDSVKMDQLFSR